MLDAAHLLAAARGGSHEVLGQVLNACRGYLLLIAGQELDPRLRAKGGASDVVQQTFLDAQRAFDRFAGDSDEELRAWLRQVLRHNLADFTRRYRDTGKRGVKRAVAGTRQLVCRSRGGTGRARPLAERGGDDARAGRDSAAGAGPPSGGLPAGDSAAPPGEALVRRDRAAAGLLGPGRAEVVVAGDPADPVRHRKP